MLEYQRSLLADERRMRAYRRAIARVVRPGDVVVDIGCGTGALSFFACEAGAARVYAIDRSHFADAALLLARHLGLADRVTVLHSDSRSVELPERADVAITETLGSFGFDEGILGILLDARRRLLRTGARLVPSSISLTLVPLEDEALFDERIRWWDEPHHGVDFGPLRLFASNSLQFIARRRGTPLADRATVVEVDLTALEATDVCASAEFRAGRDGVLHGFGVSFEATLAEAVVLKSRETDSWRDGFLPLERPIPVARGSPIRIEIQTRDGSVWAWRGAAGGERFDQTTWLAMPPCGA